MATGTVKWFNEMKGYGFIQPEQGGKDAFVHISAVERSGMSGLAEERQRVGHKPKGGLTPHAARFGALPRCPRPPGPRSG